MKAFITTLAITLAIAAQAQTTNEELGPIVHPNPTSAAVTITWKGSPEVGPVTIELLTADGRLVDRTAWVDLLVPAHIAELPTGKYLVRTTDRFWRMRQVPLIVDNSGQ